MGSIMDFIKGAGSKAGKLSTPGGEKAKIAIDIIKVGVVATIGICVAAVPVYLLYRSIKFAERVRVQGLSGGAPLIEDPTLMAGLSGGAPLIDDPTLMALSRIGSLADAAWRPAIEVLKNGVWTRRWTGNYNFATSEDAINFMKTVSINAFVLEHETYRIIAEQKQATKEVESPGSVYAPVVTRSLPEGMQTQLPRPAYAPPPAQPQYQPPVTTTKPPVTTTEPPVTTTQPPVTTTEPPVTTTEPPVAPKDTTSGQKALNKMKNIPTEIGNLSLPVKIGLGVGVAGAIGGAALLLRKKRK